MIALEVDEDTGECFVRINHICDEHAGETGHLFLIPQPAALTVVQGIARICKATGTEVELDGPTFQHHPRPAELDDPDRKRLN
jgi:hypothetical protein